MSKPSDHIDRKVAARIRELRELRGLSVRQLALASKLGPEVISRAERGLNAASVQTLARICDGLNVSMVEFFDWAAMPPSSVASAERAIDKVRGVLACIPEHLYEPFADGLEMMSRALMLAEPTEAYTAGASRGMKNHT